MFDRVAKQSHRSVRETAKEFVTRSQGQPLEGGVRMPMERSLAHDFGSVRIHTGSEAASVTDALGARAFSIGRHVVFGAGEYRPRTSTGFYVLAHELRHVAQMPAAAADEIETARNEAAENDAHQAATALVRGQNVVPVPAGLRRAGIDRYGREDDPIHHGVIDEYRYEHGIPFSGHDAGGERIGPSEAEIKYGPPARTDYVFIMGADRPHTPNPFYTFALRYFRAHYPSAVFVTEKRNLADLLTYVGGLRQPAGTIYIVSHANEDGTLSFGIDASDTDGHTDANELRAALHPPGGGASRLPNVHGNIDAQTTISIKGCNIGQSQDMVELVDEAFGGAGSVVAPKYEQTFGADSRFGAAERRRIEGRIRSTTDPREARSLRNYEERFVECAATTEGLSGPHLERPGSRLFALAEVEAYVNTDLGDLPQAERSDIVRNLFAAQRVDVVREQTERRLIPLDIRAIGAFHEQFADHNFTPRRLVAHSVAGTPPVHTYEFEDASGAGFVVTQAEPDPAALIATGRAQNSRPDNFSWSVERNRQGENVDFVAVGRRVVSELHHRTLTDSSGRPYDPSTADRRFFARSTFQPPAVTP